PVRVQLLGQEPDWLAENAVRAVELGSPGVDLNFGCPAKTVNKSRGGAVLLRDTEQLYRIVKAVRNAVPAEFPVTAKIRLGYEDTRLAIANACAIAEAGASSLAIHARTKSDGYRPPAYWPWIAKIKQQVAIPLVANGEIWNAEQALLCQEQSQCQDIMLGRGALAMPNLAQHIRLKQPPLPWPEVLALLMRYSEFEMSGEKGKYYANRVKQWFSYLKLQYPQASELFQQLRVLTRSADILALLQQQREITERAEARSV
ncbi:tRNA-dihydrouridine synthase, partial [Alishewanella sp. SMS9]|nr:tRNA-dihydrouridine synthase [Alishewanella sp. SMS9]